MNYSECTPSFQKAMAFLEKQLHDAKEMGTTRFPTVRSLAKKSGISTRSLTAAIGDLKKRGILIAIPGSGITILTDRSECRSGSHDIRYNTQQTSSHYKTNWAKIKLHIAQDILRGVYPPASKLPTIKELKAHYGTCFTTIKRALDALCDEGRLTPNNRGYKVVNLVSPRYKSTIMVLSRYHHLYELSRKTPHSQDFWRTLELECNNRSITLEYLPMRLDLMQKFYSRILNRQQSTSDPTLLGIIIEMAGMFDNLLESLLSKLSSLKIPLIFYDEHGHYTFSHLSSFAGSERYLKFIQLGVGESAGHAMGNHLLDYGHRAIACLTLGENSSWSLNRIEGLRKAFNEVGLEGQPKIRAINLRLSSGILTDLKENPLRCNLVKNHYDNSNKPQNALDNNLFSLFESTFLSCPSVYNELLEKTAHQFGAVFNEILTDKKITAWVGINDMVAIIAHHFLMSHEKDKPKITLAGFDDTLYAVYSNITSYNFNIPSAVREILHQILHSKPKEPAYIKIPGTVMHRSSRTVALSGKTFP